MKEKTDKLDFIRLRHFCSSKGTVKKINRKKQTWRKYLQNTYLTEDWYPRHIRTFCNAKKKRKKKTDKEKIRRERRKKAKDLNKLFPRETHEWSISKLKCVQYHWSI